ncbi:toprim domain-containing protein [Mycoplasma phocoeninasale]|uniref:toprim domain-containing protein n=1 Tax=Mycoplasma phocoeninasale TaxID=2726117 RepID=UPI001967AF4E|nr:toprim domain-containing protein [Mycoplasma phocoeninasale]MBN0970887.1 recombination protein RecR [Mycoplasma phocoeninasale]
MKNTNEELELLLKAIPGISKRQAQKIISYFLENDVSRLENIYQLMKQLKDKLKKCQNCNLYSDAEICSICLDKSRQQKLMIVLSQEDLKKFEALEIYSGKYFILEELYDLKKSSEKFDRNLEKLLLMAKNVSEIVIALSATVEGQFTTQFIKKILKDKINFDNAYQLSMGIPLGVQVEYVDPVTLKQSLINKTKI